jgi:hypothetical protein
MVVVKSWPLAALCAALAVGCGKQNDGRAPLYPASGQVTVGGQPAAGAEVVFYGATSDLQGPGTIAPVGTTDENGRYQLSSYGVDDGAPAGKFNVTVHWPEPIPPGADEEMYQPKDRLKQKYLDPKSAGITMEIPVGGGELPPIAL